MLIYCLLIVQYALYFERKIKLEFRKAFDLIVGKIETELVKNGYKREKVASENSDELVALFTSQNVA